jgi:hypothetical protein
MALTKSDVRITDTRETAGTNGSQGLVAVIRVTYTVRNKGPFVVDLPKAGFTGEQAIAKIMSDAEERVKLLDAFSE